MREAAARDSLRGGCGMVMVSRVMLGGGCIHFHTSASLAPWLFTYSRQFTFAQERIATRQILQSKVCHQLVIYSH